jgi:hypothetical protein
MGFNLEYLVTMGTVDALVDLFAIVDSTAIFPMCVYHFHGFHGWGICNHIVNETIRRFARASFIFNVAPFTHIVQHNVGINQPLFICHLLPSDSMLLLPIPCRPFRRQSDWYHIGSWTLRIQGIAPTPLLQSFPSCNPLRHRKTDKVSIQPSFIPPQYFGTFSDGNDFTVKEVSHLTVTELVPLTQSPILDATPEPMAVTDSLEVQPVMFRYQHFITSYSVLRCYK